MIKVLFVCHGNKQKGRYECKYPGWSGTDETR